MRVGEVMTRGIKAIALTASIEDARSLMRLHGIHHLVVTKASRVVGVLSERDIGGRRGLAARAQGVVSDVMTEPVVTVEPTATVRQAANLMRGRSIGCLVVTKSNRTVGIVTVSDLLELVGRGVEHGSVAPKRWALRHRTPHRGKRVETGVW